jgi:hypothetical protein
MNKLDLPADVVAKLAAVNDPMKVYDEKGEAQAVVVPPGLFQDMWEAWVDQHYDEAEMARRKAEPGGYTTAEAIAYLNKVASEYRPQ